MRDFFKMLFLIGLVVVVYIYRNTISNYILDNIIFRQKFKVLAYNEYYLNYDYKYVQNTDSREIHSKQEVLNVFYTVLNSGDTDYTFICKYDECIDDIKALINNRIEISDINNFVHPFNSFSSINVSITNNRNVTITVEKNYNEVEVNYIKNYINNFIKNNIRSNMSDRDKIKAFHDYVINNTIYDSNGPKSSYTAYTLITTGRSICGGYSDIMAIYLDTLGIQNYKISSDNHVWNLVKLDNKWYHLDLTWDDPVANDGKQYLLHNFFLIDTDELLKLDSLEHNFNKFVYAESN